MGPQPRHTLPQTPEGSAGGTAARAGQEAIQHSCWPQVGGM
jgi:hypothetical protein